MTAEKQKRRTVQISFKNDPKDDMLFEFLNQRYSAPAFIKEILWDLCNNKTPLINGAAIYQAETIPVAETVVVNSEPVKAQEERMDPMASLFNEDVEREEIEIL